MFPLANSAARSNMAVFKFLGSTSLFSFTAMNNSTAAGEVIDLDPATMVGLDEATQIALREKVSFVTLSLTVHPYKVFIGCRYPTNTLASTMYELPRHLGLDVFALDLSSLLVPNALMSICKPVPRQLKLVRFNVPGNPVPFTTHSCDDFFVSLKYEMLFDILESELQIEYVGQVAKKDIAEWLHDCRQARLGAK
jgi:hypothetical protein